MGSGFSCTGQVSACPGARSGANRLVTLREATPGLSEISWPGDGQFRSAKPIYIPPKTFILGSHNKVGRITLARPRRGDDSTHHSEYHSNQPERCGRWP